jgi:D-sedoheptulose 7-phosphate isomerase
MSIQGIIESSIQVKQSIVADAGFISRIEDVVQVVVTCLKKGGKILFCGNGVSAADAQHLAAEFTGRFYTDRPPLAAEALHCNTSYLTAVANDYSFDVVYSRMVEGMAKPGDVLVAISTSGNSANIINAVKQANQQQVITVGMTGRGGGQLSALCQHLLNVPSDDTPRIQESHIMIGHIICQLVEQEIFPR